MLDALRLYDAGYTALVSVVPPNGTVAEHSKISQEDAGKSPGIKNYQGQYVGYPWMKIEPTRQQVHQWTLDGNNVGFGGWSFPAFDIDVVDEELANAAVAAVERVLGPCVIRYGRRPKALIICRCATALRSFDVRYIQRHPLLGDDKQLIQFLGAGRQYVVSGIHPVTMQPYEAVDPLHALGLMGPAALPELTPAKVEEVFDAITEALAKFDYHTDSRPNAEPGSADVPQEGLKAPDADALQRLVAQLPNTTPDREEYVSVGYAIKGASQDFPGEGLAAYQEWCGRWEQGYNDPEQVARDWEKMVPPYRAGFDFLLNKGSAWGANLADFVFGEAEAPPKPDATPSPLFMADAEEDADDTQLAELEATNFSDVALAEEFLRLHRGRIMTVPELSSKAVYIWDGKQWQEGGKGNKSSMQDMVVRFLKNVNQRAQLTIENPVKQAEIGMRLGSLFAIKTVTSIVQGHASVRRSISDLDANLDIINTPEGPINLKTGERLAPSPKRSLLKRTGVSPAPFAVCPQWEAFLDQISVGQEDFKTYLKRLAGYALTGHTVEQIFPFFIGPGGNGKSLFISVLSEILGDYSTSVPSSLFQKGKAGNDTAYHLALLQGARLVSATETSTGTEWNEQLIKQLTGDDEITGRHPYGSPFSFTSQATLIVVGNYAPSLEAVGPAIVRRLQMVPWTYIPQTPDKALKQKLWAELPGIMAWAIEGAQEWYEHGLAVAESVVLETEDYLDEQDAIGAWLRKCVILGKPSAGEHKIETPTTALYDSYRLWMQAHRAQPLGSRKFAQLLSAKMRAAGVRKARIGEDRARGWAGVVLLDEVSETPALPPNVARFPAVAPPTLAKPESR